MVTTLLDQLWANEPRLTKDLKPILRELTNLVRGETSTVSLKARYKSCKFSIVVKNLFGLFGVLYLQVYMTRLILIERFWPFLY